MLEENIVDSVRVIFESTAGEEFQESLGLGYVFCSIPSDNFSFYMQLIIDSYKSKVVYWVRGGFKPWIKTIEEIKKRNSNWILFYGANTGNERWPYWDIILDDLDPLFKFIGEKIYFPYYKPINTNVFRVYEEDETPYNSEHYDICIGASNIHDKKGQWKAIEVLKAYKKLFGEELSWVMPGALRRGVNTNKMMDSINDLSRGFFTGKISRELLAGLMNRCKVFIHLGSGGQGDRGPLEAMSCGCKVIVGNTFRHSPSVILNSNVCEGSSYEQIAKQLRSIMEDPEIESRKSNYYGIEKSFSYLESLFAILNKYSPKEKQNSTEDFLKGFII